MRDLYKRLGVSTSSTKEEIQEAISRCANGGLKEDASTILLNPNNRRKYDQFRFTFITIGQVRNRLRLSISDHWLGTADEDFTPQTVYRTTPLQDFNLSIKNSNQSPRRPRGPQQKNYNRENLYKLLVFFGVIIFIGWIAVSTDTVSQTPISSRTAPAPTSQSPRVKSQPTAILPPIFSEPIQALPLSGTTRWYVSKSNVAPLEVKTSSGSNYLLKVSEYSTNNDVVSLFIRGGATEEILLPLGTYKIKYAVGKEWYGYEYLFGPSTSYSKANEQFRFKSSYSGYTGYTLTLYQVAHGNLTTSSISAGEF